MGRLRAPHSFLARTGRPGTLTLSPALDICDNVLYLIY